MGTRKFRNANFGIPGAGAKAMLGAGAKAGAVAGYKLDLRSEAK